MRCAWRWHVIMARCSVLSSQYAYLRRAAPISLDTSPALVNNPHTDSYHQIPAGMAPSTTSAGGLRMASKVLIIDGDDQGHFFLMVDGQTLYVGDDPTHADSVLTDLR